MTARAEGQARAEKLATAILVMMTSTYTYEQLTNALTHALAEARREGEQVGLETALQLANGHECGGEDDIVCQGQNCAAIISGSISLHMKAIRQSSERMTLSRSGVKQPHGAGEESSEA